MLGERGRMEIGCQAVCKLVLCKCHCYNIVKSQISPRKLTVELGLERSLVCFHSFPHSGDEKVKQKQNWFLALHMEKGHFGRARWARRSIIWHLHFLVPRSRRHPGPVQFPEEAKNSSNLAWESPSPSQESTQTWEKPFRGLLFRGYQFWQLALNPM